MLLLLHILIAVSSLAYTTYLYFFPTKSKFPNAYALVGLTLASGTALVVVNPAQLTSACNSGLMYLAVVSVGIAMARVKLSRVA